MTVDIEDLSDEELERTSRNRYDVEEKILNEIWRRYKNKNAALKGAEVALEAKRNECEELKMEISHGMPWR